MSYSLLHPSHSKAIQHLCVMDSLKRGENEVLVKSLEMIAAGESRAAIYEYWQANLEDLKDENLLMILEQYAKAKLSSLTGRSAYRFADNLVDFNIHIQEFLLGSIAINQELAIKSCELALTVFTFQDYLQDWARLKSSLGIAYWARIRGERADNLETAIACYQEALKVFTLDTFPFDWARTQMNLGVAYQARIRGERADNLETAIAFYQEALNCFTFTAFPFDWARTQMNLGVAFQNRIRGEHTDNLESAISCYQEALKVFTLTAFPYYWAVTQMNLGTAYQNRIRGEQADNLETAIACYQDALKVYTFTAFPQDWATTQMNLAIAYRNRIRGERADNLETAIACYQEALNVYTLNAFPQDWAMTQSNLGNAYSDRIRGEQTANFEASLNCYKKALQGFETGGDWLRAATMALHLGKLSVEQGSWYQGLDYLQKSLAIHRRFEDLPGRADTIYEIARTHHLIGNYEKASVSYRDALRLYQHLNKKRSVAFCQFSLGRIYLQTGFVAEACEQLETAKQLFLALEDSQPISEIG